MVVYSLMNMNMEAGSIRCLIGACSSALCNCKKLSAYQFRQNEMIR